MKHEAAQRRKRYWSDPVDEAPVCWKDGHGEMIPVGWAPKTPPEAGRPRYQYYCSACEADLQKYIRRTASAELAMPLR